MIELARTPAGRDIVKSLVLLYSGAGRGLVPVAGGRIGDIILDHEYPNG